MASISLYRKRASLVAQWSSWASLGGSDAVNTTFYDYVVYSANINYSGAQNLQSVTVGFPVAYNVGISRQATITCYMYTSDPSGNGSHPSGFIKSGSVTRNLTGSTAVVSFTFSNMSVTAGTVYFWFDVAYNTGDDGVVAYAIHGSATISGQFKSNPTMSLSFSGTASSITMTVANGNGTSLKATFKAPNGQTLYTSSNFSTGSLTVKPDLPTWFNKAGITESTYLTVSVSVTGGNPNPVTGSFTINAAGSSAIKPVVGTPSAAIVQGASAAEAYPSTYIAGISKCKVTAIVTRPTNAAIDDDKVYLSYPGGATVKMTRVGTADKFQGTTAAPITGNTTFTVQVTDVRGQTAQNTISISDVVAYTLPSVTRNYLKRCDSDGNEDSGGEYYQIRVTANINTKLPNNDVTKLTVGIKGDANRYDIRSGETSKHGGLTQPNQAYTLTVIIQDKISGEVKSEYKIEGKQRDFVLSHVGGKTHLGIGTTPIGGSENSVELPMNGQFLAGGIPVQAFPEPYSASLDGASFGKDFLSVNAADRHAAENASTIFRRPKASQSDWSNAPATVDGYNWWGYRFVLWANSSFQMVVIIELYPSPGRIWSNFHNGTSGWYGWRYTAAVAPS